MQFEVLGPLRVIADDGVDVTPRGEQQRRVLALLVASSPTPVSVDAVSELLWGGPPPSANAIQSLISKLRKIVAPTRIEADGRGYSLAGEFETDLDQFERHVSSGEFEAAEQLVRGEPLIDVADAVSVGAERARLSAAIRAARHKRLEAQVEGPSPLDVMAELDSLVVAEPLDEAWWALLMRVQHRRGQQADALRTFQRARRVLADELGLAPGPELRRLEQSILAGTPVESPPVGAASPITRLDEPPGSAVVVRRPRERPDGAGRRRRVAPARHARRAGRHGQDQHRDRARVPGRTRVIGFRGVGTAARSVLDRACVGASDRSSRIRPDHVRQRHCGRGSSRSSRRRHWPDRRRRC